MTIIKGNKYANRINGTRYADELYGYEGNDTLSGGGGNDLLDGGTGLDMMSGGSGNDIFVVDNAGDVVIEYSNEGTDTVRSSVNFTLGANVENLELLAGAVTGTGNTRDNVLTGNTLNNSLGGDAGNDTLDGRAGDDTLSGGAGSDTYLFALGDGLDTIREVLNGSEIDTIRFATGILPGQVSLVREGNDLLVRIAGGDELRIAGHYAGSGIEKIQFANGTAWGSAELDKAVWTIDGTTGSDSLSGHAGTDLIDGKAGDDVLQGGAGSDTYIFAPGSGRDTIRETLNATDTDTVRFMSGITPDQVRLLRQGGDLLVRLSSGDEVKVAGQYGGAGIEKIEFENGIVWGVADINNAPQEFIGTLHPDTLVGDAGTDLIYGMGGDDVLQGMGGSDTYFFNPGDGRDTIYETVNAGEVDTLRFAPSVTPESVSMIRQGADLVIRMVNGDEVRVVGQYADMGIEKIEFGNGIVWGASEINQAPSEIIGTGNADVLAGDAGTDLIHGMGGDDTLQGMGGGDTYFFNPGDGRDTVRESVNAGEIDTLRFASAVTPESVSMIRQGADLVIRMVNGDEVRVVGQYADMGIEKIEFGNGIVWGAAEINQAPSEIIGTGNADVLAGDAGTDLIHGMGGDDTLQGMAGGDTYFFNPGDGRDTVRESVNAGEIDTLRFASTIAPENASMIRQGADLVIRMVNGDEVRVAGQYAGMGIEKIEFGNGIVWGAAEINQAPSEIIGTGNADVLTGDAGTDLIRGMGGDDTLQGMGGGDTYFFNPGDGRDTIRETVNAGEIDTLRFASSSVTAENTRLIGQGADLLIRLYNGEEVRIVGQYAGMGIEKIEFGNGVVWGDAEISSVPTEIFGSDGNDVLLGHDGTDLIHGMGGDDVLQGMGGSDTYFFNLGGHDTIRETVNAGEIDTLRLTDFAPDKFSMLRQGADLLIRLYNGDDVRIAGQYADMGVEKIEFGNGAVWGAAEINNIPAEIFGTENADTLFGDAGPDLIHGIGGDDVLQGMGGGDTYFFNPGDGRDTIREIANAGEIDTLRLATSVTPENISLLRQDADLVIRLFSGDEVRVAGQYTGMGIEKIEFGNGTVWGATEINNVPVGILGTEYADVLVGDAGADLIRGMGGDDVLQGMGGGDTYFFNYGDGRDIIRETADAGEIDTLRFTSSVTPENARLIRQDADLVIRLYNGEEVRVAGQYANSGIEKIEFGNGVVWGAAEINNIPAEIYGTDGNDVLIGHAGTDLIHGMGGDDVLHGMGGGDTYFFNLGGHDTIREVANAGETDTLRLTDFAPDKFSMLRQGDDLVVRLYNGDDVRVAGQYAGMGIERIEFGNGAVWGIAEINGVPSEPVFIQPVGVSSVTIAEYPLAV